MALIYEPRIFKQFSTVRAALSLRGTTNLPFGFNMSLTVGDDEDRVRANRARLATRLGFAPDRLATQRQVHGDICRTVSDDYAPADSDALITRTPGWLLAVSVADCIPLLLHDPVAGLVAGIHSGWRGTAADIAGKTIRRLIEREGCRADNLHCYVGASAGQCCYEVGEDVAMAFDAGHSRPHRPAKYFFDNKGAVLKQVLAAGIAPERVELDPRCTICDPHFHSYRRDGNRSGRMFGVIGIRAVDAGLRR